MTQLFKESWTLKQIYEFLNSIYLETRGNLGFILEQPFNVESKKPGINAEHVVRILRLVDYNDVLSRLEGRYYNLKSEVKSLEANEREFN